MSGQPTTDATETTFFHPDLFVIPADGGKPYLLGYKCNDCGKFWFPKLEMCPHCWTELQQVPLSKTGKLYSYAVIHIGAKGVKTPYIIAWIDMPENLRIFSQLAIPLEKVKIGMEVEVAQGIIKVGDDGKPVLSYMFKAVE